MDANPTLFRKRHLFYGSGREPQHADLLVRDGRVAALGQNLPAPAGRHGDRLQRPLADAGLLDIHTHLDLEVELATELPEAGRHGTTR